MPIPLHISPRIITSIASLYNDTNRIFMEYIDNALDSAEVYFDNGKNGYTKKISITLKIEGTTFKTGKVIISDNCTGISNFTKVVQSIGDSEKAGQFTTNGQFGYGIYSFMAACERLEVISKTEIAKALFMPINRSQFDTSKQEDVSFPTPKNISFSEKSGTQITLSQFEKYMWKAIDLDLIKSEIEKHFELMLSRKNLEIKVIDSNNSIHTCMPFDHGAFEGEVWNDTIDTLLTTKGRKKPLEIEFSLDNKPIKVFLKITKGKVIDKSPVFIIKGRRIAEVREVKSFRTNHKGDIWAHPNLTGYIDLGGFLKPTIARNDFKKSPESKAVFEKLSELEELILLFLKDVNKKSDEKHYKELEDELNSALSKLAKIDQMNFRTELISGKKSQGIISNGIGKSMINGIEEETESSEEEFFDGDGEYNWEGNEEKQKEKQDANESENNKPIESDNPFEGDLKGEERKKSGFNIEISERDPDIDAENNEPQRSNLVGSTIIIFRKHPDFAKRVDKRRSGESIITQRLITYLAGEITVHYKDKFVTRAEQPSYNKKMFSSVVDFIYKFEDMLSGLVNKNLGDII